jgi:hypothetical protein
MDPQYDPDTVDSCSYKTIVTVSRGTPDYKGRYFYSYKLYQGRQDNFLEIKNHSLFKNCASLEDTLNLFVKKEFNELYAQSDDCFLDFRLKHYNLDDFGIQLKDSVMIFNLSFGLPAMCLAVDGVTIRYKIKNLKRYLKW